MDAIGSQRAGHILAKDTGNSILVHHAGHLMREFLLAEQIGALAAEENIVHGGLHRHA